jgi:hypothetical protein
MGRNRIGRPRKEIIQESHEAEDKVYDLLRSNGIKVIRSNYKSPYDYLYEGKRIELKHSKGTMRLDGHTIWKFNIHRHGVLDESQVDFYIFRLENVPEFSYAIHLVIPAPLGSATLEITLRSLITQYAIHFNRFDLIGP